MNNASDHANGLPPSAATGKTGAAHDSNTAILDALATAACAPNTDMGTRNLLQQAHDALRDSMTNTDTAQQRYRALFDAVPDPISIIAADGTLLDLNKAGMQAYNRPREDVIGKNIRVLNPDLPQDHLIPVWQTLNRGETYVIEATNMRADGTRFPVEVHSANLQHDGFKAIVAVARDLSGRHEAELRYRELMEVIDKGIVVQDSNLDVIYSNRAAMLTFGIGESLSLTEQLHPEHWRYFDEDGHDLPEDELPPNRALRSSLVIEGVLLGMYHRRRRQLVWLTMTSVPQFAPGSDHPTQVTTIFSDVTALKRDSAMFDRAQMLAHIGGWEWDSSHDQLFLTDEAMRILGPAQMPQVLGDLLACLLQPDHQRLRTAFDDVFQNGGSFDVELQGCRSDGRPFWVRMIGEVDEGEHAIAHVTGTLQDISLDKRAEEILRIQALTDPLTGLMNRDAVLNELGARLNNPAQAHVAVLYIDLDRFKTVNDVLGHSAGDQLLTAATRRITDAVGSEGRVARFGGDEFLVLCDIALDPQSPERLADTILDALSDTFHFGTADFTITASSGIARAPQDGLRPQQLIQNADMAMYESKHRTRNAWHPFTPELARRQQDRLQIETQLHRAVDNQEFHLVYQPQVNLRTGEIVAAEALIRWQSHQLGELRPDLFINHAENTGDIVRIGSWVLREACRQVRAWRDQGLGTIRVAVNVSYRQFLGDDLSDSVRSVLDEFDLPGSALELEFTERVLIEDAPATLKTFAELRALGVMLAIDDFGEGYSALNYLRRLPIHGLKISQLFIEGVPSNRSDVAVCQAVSAIARSLSLGLVAEGVESEVQRQFLLQLGVQIGQGFLFAPGLPPDEFARRLRATLPGNITHA
jgi:diguanylate cyclase (GGDEF)-like protein/PAS domain S-box-containing protein